MVVSGVLVPAGTTVWPIMAEVLKGDHWGDGTSFRPERFIDEAGRVRRDEHFIPFSIGKRVGSKLKLDNFDINVHFFTIFREGWY